MTKRDASYIGLLAMAIAALYLPFLGNPLQFDDLAFLKSDAYGRWQVDSMPFSLFELRSLPYATFAWSKAVFGDSIIPLRLSNLFLHWAVVMALYFFVREVSGAVTRMSEKEMQMAAFFAALLFALHPVSVYGAGYLAQRTILMATLFGLLMLLSWTRALQGQQAGWRWLSVVLYFLAVTSKEHAIMLPAVLGVLTVLLLPDWRSKLKTFIPQMLAFVAISFWVLYAKRHWVGAAYELNATEMLVVGDTVHSSWQLSVLTQSWLFFKYSLLWILPNPRWMSVDMREPFAQALASPYLGAFVAYLAWGGGALWLLLRRGKVGVIGFGMLFPWLLFFTEFAAVRVQEPFVLYRSYLWAAGAFVVIPVIFSLMDRRLAVMLGLAVAVLLVPASMDRQSTFSHPYLLWNDATEKIQGKEDLNGVYRIYFNRGTVLLKMDDYDGAIRDLAHSIQLLPDSPFPYANLGLAFEKKGMLSDAVIAYGEAIKFEEPEWAFIVAGAWHGRGRVFEALGRESEAILDFNMSCKLGKKGCEKLTQ